MDTRRKAAIPDTELIRARYEKQLILRLVQVCDTIVSDAPELATRTNFSDLWSIAMTVTSQGLVLASHQPLLDAWVSTAERLVRNGIHKRYPDAHPARHLKNFARVLLSWAAYLPDGTKGEISIVGPQVFPLFYGNLILAGGSRDASEALSWEVEGGSLRIGEKGKGPILAASLSDCAGAVVCDEDWRLIRPAKLRSTSIDTWTPEYHRNYAALPDPVFLELELQKVFAELDEEVSIMVQTICPCATLLPKSIDGESRPQQWIAGLMRMPATGFDTRRLVEAACRDLIERMLTIKPLWGVLGPLSPGSDFRSLFIEMAAERLGYRLLADASKPREAAEKWHHWPGVVSRLRQSEDGLSFLAQLGEDAGESTAATIQSAAAPPKAGEFDPTFPVELVFKKTRRDSAFSIDDFSALATIGEVDRDQLKSLLPRLMEDVHKSEGRAFYAAAAAYSLGHFEQCVEALSWCLRFDDDVEEYWHILAFALRYLGRRDDFNMIVFAGVRNTGLLEVLR